ncbi:PhnA domain-containing protein [Halioxenophilus aromaticivorans]|uniref:Alkylphosphonate utilization protein n=1 Tax=Halioxenophilus aromaticivorans TaxID=1306992 RepID=A0AAV3U0N0_9ALTE
MSKQTALKRAGKQCELCGAPGYPQEYTIPFSEGIKEDQASVAVCERCMLEINRNPLNTDHWMCLQSSAWSPHAPVQVLAYRILRQIDDEDWSLNLLDSMFMEADTKAWAEQGENEEASNCADCNGNPLYAGDTVTVVKDLPVKGTGFVAKRGTAVRGISLTNNPMHIEGKVNGTRVVLLTKFVKKQN